MVQRNFIRFCCPKNVDSFLIMLLNCSSQRKHDKYLGQMRTGWHVQVLKYDLLRDYRNTIPLEEQVSNSLLHPTFSYYVTESQGIGSAT